MTVDGPDPVRVGHEWKYGSRGAMCRHVGTIPVNIYHPSRRDVTSRTYLGAGAVRPARSATSVVESVASKKKVGPNPGPKKA